MARHPAGSCRSRHRSRLLDEGRLHVRAWRRWICSGGTLCPSRRECAARLDYRGGVRDRHCGARHQPADVHPAGPAQRCAHGIELGQMPVAHPRAIASGPCGVALDHAPVRADTPRARRRGSRPARRRDRRDCLRPPLPGGGESLRRDLVFARHSPQHSRRRHARLSPTALVGRATSPSPPPRSSDTRPSSGAAC